jgi:hypothetical protein
MDDQESPRVEFSLEGDPRDDGLVLAQDFLRFLESALDTLRRLEIERGRKPVIDYRIVGLDIGSAVIALEPEPRYKDAPAVIADFLAGIAAVRDGTIESSRFRPETQRSFVSLLRPLSQSHLRSVTVSSDSVAVQLVGVPELALRELHAPELAAVGTMSGYIDAVNVHDEPVFFLYPVAGPSRIRCLFDRALLEQVKGALKQFVSVRGLQEYPANSPFPTRIVVDSIEVHLESEIVPIEALWGSVPELTRDLDSVSYVRLQRDAQE